MKKIVNKKWVAEDFTLTLKMARSVRAGTVGGSTCIRGIKLWAEHHGFDWKKIVREGLDAQTIIDTGDVRAIVCLLKAYRLYK